MNLLKVGLAIHWTHSPTPILVYKIKYWESLEIDSPIIGANILNKQGLRDSLYKYYYSPVPISFTNIGNLTNLESIIITPKSILISDIYPLTFLKSYFYLKKIRAKRKFYPFIAIYDLACNSSMGVAQGLRYCA